MDLRQNPSAEIEIQIISYGNKIVRSESFIGGDDLLAHHLVPGDHDDQDAFIGQQHQLNLVEGLIRAWDSSDDAKVASKLREQLRRPFDAVFNCSGLPQLGQEPVQFHLNYTAVHQGLGETLKRAFSRNSAGGCMWLGKVALFLRDPPSCCVWRQG